MKLKISELKPNPFKKQISKGELNKEQVNKIKANIKELGFFRTLPVVKIKNNYHLIAGHNSLQALKEVYGKDYEVEVTLNNYNEEQIAKGMIIENLTQRSDDYREKSDNVIFARGFLTDHKEVWNRCRIDTGRHIEKLKNEYKDKVTANDISEWLDKNTSDVIPKNEINELIRIKENLNPQLEKKVNKKHDKPQEEREDDTPNYTQAIILSGIENKKEQEQLLKVLKKTREQRVREQGKLISQYKQAPEEVKEQIKQGSIDLADIDLALTQYNLRQRKNKTIKVEDISKKINSFIDRLSFSIGDTENNLKGVIKDIVVISKYTNDMNKRQKARLSMKIDSFGELLSKVSKLMDEIKERI